MSFAQIILLIEKYHGLLAPGKPDRVDQKINGRKDELIGTNAYSYINRTVMSGRG
jgi:hypothetical protein